MKDLLKKSLRRAGKSPTRSGSEKTSTRLPNEVSTKTFATAEGEAYLPQAAVRNAEDNNNKTEFNILEKPTGTPLPPHSPASIRQRADSRVEDEAAMQNIILAQAQEVKNDDNLHDLTGDRNRLNQHGGLRQDPIASAVVVGAAPKKKNWVKETITRFFAGMSMVRFYKLGSSCLM
jgi:hypothetical protein